MSTIEQIYVVVADNPLDEGGTHEGIVAVLSGDMWIPAFCSREDVALMMFQQCQQTCDEKGNDRPLKLLKFSVREDVTESLGGSVTSFQKN